MVKLDLRDPKESLVHRVPPALLVPPLESWMSSSPRLSLTTRVRIRAPQ